MLLILDRLKKTSLVSALVHFKFKDRDLTQKLGLILYYINTNKIVSVIIRAFEDDLSSKATNWGAGTPGARYLIFAVPLYLYFDLTVHTNFLNCKQCAVITKGNECKCCHESLNLSLMLMENVIESHS